MINSVSYSFCNSNPGSFKHGCYHEEQLDAAVLARNFTKLKELASASQYISMAASARALEHAVAADDCELVEAILLITDIGPYRLFDQAIKSVTSLPMMNLLIKYGVLHKQDVPSVKRMLDGGQSGRKALESRIDRLRNVLPAEILRQAVIDNNWRGSLTPGQIRKLSYYLHPDDTALANRLNATHVAYPYTIVQDGPRTGILLKNGKLLTLYHVSAEQLCNRLERERDSTRDCSNIRLYETRFRDSHSNLNYLTMEGASRSIEIHPTVNNPVLFEPYPMHERRRRHFGQWLGCDFTIGNTQRTPIGPTFYLANEHVKRADNLLVSCLPYLSPPEYETPFAFAGRVLTEGGISPNHLTSLLPVGYAQDLDQMSASVKNTATFAVHMIATMVLLHTILYACTKRPLMALQLKVQRASAWVSAVSHVIGRDSVGDRFGAGWEKFRVGVPIFFSQLNHHWQHGSFRKKIRFHHCKTLALAALFPLVYRIFQTFHVYRDLRNAYIDVLHGHLLPSGITIGAIYSGIFDHPNRMFGCGPHPLTSIECVKDISNHLYREFLHSRTFEHVFDPLDSELTQIGALFILVCNMVALFRTPVHNRATLAGRASAILAIGAMGFYAPEGSKHLLTQAVANVAASLFFDVVESMHLNVRISREIGKGVIKELPNALKSFDLRANIFSYLESDPMNTHYAMRELQLGNYHNFDQWFSRPDFNQWLFAHNPDLWWGKFIRSVKYAIGTRAIQEIKENFSHEIKIRETIVDYLIGEDKRKILEETLSVNT